MTPHTGLTRLALGAAGALLLLGALTGTVSAYPDVVKPHGVFRLTGTLPSWLLAPEMETNCLMRWEGDWVSPNLGSVVFREVCYRGTTIDPNATPGPPPYLGDIPEYTFHHEVLGPGVYYERGTVQFPDPDLLLISILPCTAVLPGSLYVSFWMEFDIDGGQETGTAHVTTDDSSNCNSGTTTDGSITLDPLPLDNDTDGDGCTDWYELGANPELGGLNDPFNPDPFDVGHNDCTAVLTPDGLYEISHDYDGGYRRCKGSVDDVTLDMRVYCYTDSTTIDINPEAYPGEKGDGLPGAPPPGPDLLPGPDEWLVFGDVNATHTVLPGTYNAGTNTITFSGCFEDLDGQDPLGDIYVVWDWNVQTDAGTSKMWTEQCSSAGAWDDGTLQALKLATTAQSDACYAQPPSGDGTCPFGDTDGDGVPDARELEDDAACGRRDPFNPHDYYDVSQPKDTVIDLANDILGVILHFAPGGYPPGDENWDRPPGMADSAAGSTWNRGSPDGVIDLANDILGVNLQFNPGGC